VSDTAPRALAARDWTEAPCGGVTCGKEQACCLSNGSEAGPEYACTEPKPDGGNPCGTAEICLRDSDCHTAGTSCRWGDCRAPQPAARVACGDLTCEGETPVCCAYWLNGVTAPDSDPVSALICADRCIGAPELAPELEPQFALVASRSCDGPSDCPRHEQCILVPATSDRFCALLGGHSTTVVCDGPSDCDAFCSDRSDGRTPTCDRLEGETIKTCNCLLGR
jgi:hypothetical protein